MIRPASGQLDLFSAAPSGVSPRWWDPPNLPLPGSSTRPRPRSLVPDVPPAAPAISSPPVPDVAEPRLLLPWDFRASFPVPLDEAIEQGRLDASDLVPANLAAIHEEHAREALSVLADVDAVASARRAGVDPATGKRPRTPSLRGSLPARLTATLDRLRHRFDLLMDVYAEAFGDEAAAAFRKAIVARHAGVEIARDERSRHARIDVP